jgi:vanillate O-demethylase monooxygenase subunit
MPYLMNTWYAAAWTDEVVPDALLSRTLLDQSVLLYRDAGGVAHAIGNRCPHRFAPLDRGVLNGDAVECGYHGLRFDKTGACIFNPHGSGRIAANMRVPSWPLAERHGVLWIWMGEAERADKDCIVDVSKLVDPTLGVIRGSMRMEAGSEVVADNLMDLSHTQFLHASYLNAGGFLTAENDDRQEGDTVVTSRRLTNIAAPPRFAQFMDNPAGPVDHWTRSRWDPPGIIRLDVGVTAVNAPEDLGLRHFGTHMLTPETATTCHYFYASIRNYRVGDEEADEFMRGWHRTGFGLQDRPMIEAVQRMMGNAEFTSLHPVLLESDGAALRARSVMRRLIARERSSDSVPVPA